MWYKPFRKLGPGLTYPGSLPHDAVRDRTMNALRNLLQKPYAFWRRLLALARGRTAVAQEEAMLRHLARHTSRTVGEIASPLKLSTDDTLATLADLESRGLVKLSPDKGTHHARIAALTSLGRKGLQ